MTPRSARVLEREQLLPRSRAEVFPFFEDARNLERITPPFLRFYVTTEGAISMRPGAVIDYRLSLFGLPFPWRTEITHFDPPNSFVDVQVRGPYRLWRHTHTFLDEGSGTRMIDRVEYQLPFGPLGSLAHALFVERTLRRIFAYRATIIGEIFRADAP